MCRSPFGCRVDLRATLSCIHRWRRPLATASSSMDPYSQITCIKDALHVAAGAAAQELSRQRRLSSVVWAKNALGVLRASRRGDSRGVVARGAQANPELQEFVDDRHAAVLDTVGLLDYIRFRAIAAADEESRYVTATPRTLRSASEWSLRRPGDCSGVSDGLGSVASVYRVGVVRPAPLPKLATCW